MKRTLMLFVSLVVMLIFMSNSVPRYVYANEEVTAELDTAGGLDDEQFIAENNRLRALGRQLRMRRQSTICALARFPKLFQGDDAWKECIMKKKNLSIGDSGCCLTSFTMIQQYYGGTDTPDLVNTTMGEYACLFDYEQAAKRYGYKITVREHLLDGKTVSYEDTVDYVWAAVWEGHPVLIGMTYVKKNGKTGTHFVVAYGYAYDNILIRDPASKDYQYLRDYIDLGYSINRIYVFVDE